MTSPIGVDTSWLVTVTLAEAVGHSVAEAMLARILSDGDKLALVPQVLDEFAHVVTDARRFQNPLSFQEALDAVDSW